jgi:LPS sulfotransferase NodH
VVVTDYLQRLYAQPGFDAVGFKLMRTHCRQFPTVVQYLVNEMVPAIHVVRRNVLKTVISRETTRQRKLFHAKSNVPVQKISIDVKSLLPALERIVADNKEWERIFSNSPYLQVSYESFVSYREAELRRIYEFLSVKPDISVSSSLVKINPDAIRDVLLNYEEVCRVLEGTPFASSLTE